MTANVVGTIDRQIPFSWAIQFINEQGWLII